MTRIFLAHAGQSLQDPAVDPGEPMLVVSRCDDGVNDCVVLTASGRLGHLRLWQRDSGAIRIVPGRAQ